MMTQGRLLKGASTLSAKPSNCFPPICKMLPEKAKNRSYFFIICSLLFIGMALISCSSLPKKTQPSLKPITGVGEDKSSQMVYEWLKTLQFSNGLLESAENSNFVSLYDNSLAAIVFSFKGDFERAEKIFNFFNKNLESEMKQFPGGFGQTRDREGIPSGGTPHRWLGDNAWLLIALNNYHHLAGNRKYSELADALEAWIRSLQDETDGGLWGGFDKEGNKIGKATEGIIDAFNAVNGYDSFHSKVLQFLKTKYWDPDEKVFLAWKEHPKYKYALDLHSWGYCGFPNMPSRLLEEADRFRTTKIATINNKNITGFGCDVDLDNVWLEGTGEMVVAYRTAGIDFMAEYYIRELEKIIVSSSKNRNLGGIPHSTNRESGYGVDRLWEGVDRNPCISSSAWYLLGKWGFDPMALGRNKNIPAKDFFRAEDK